MEKIAKEILFETSIFKFQIKLQNKEEIIKIIKNKYSKNPYLMPKYWNCNIHSSFTKKGGDYFLNDISHVIMKKFNLIKENFDINYGNYLIKNIWYNVYDKNQYQEIHDHGDSFYSGVYYLKISKCHNGTIFCNPNHLINFSKVEKNEKFVKSIDIEEEDLIFFPSYLRHGVLPSKECEDLRITISFNIINDYLDQDSYTKKTHIIYY